MHQCQGNHGDPRDHLVPLETLDLRKLHTVSAIVDGLSRCSFGGRMLGDVAATVTDLCKQPHKPTLVFDGNTRKPVFHLLREMCERGWFNGLITSAELGSSMSKPDTIVVVGGYTERYEDDVYSVERTIFINRDGQCKPGQVRDGWYPDAVFEDPEFVLPVLFATLSERLSGKPVTPQQLFDFIREHGFGGEAKNALDMIAVQIAMLQDETSTNFFTTSGAMTVAKMQYLMCDLLATGKIHYMAATGALMAHGLIEGTGCKHFKYDPSFGDGELAAAGMNRVTDTLEPESNFDHIERIVTDVLNQYDGERAISASILHHAIGKYLADNYPDARSVFLEAYKRNIPIVVPAIVDSELGNDLFVHNIRRVREGKRPIIMDQEQDSRILFDLATSAKRMGIFSIGGGVPRNNTQNVAPLVEIHDARLNEAERDHQVMYFYGSRIDPSRPWHGHLGGCKYIENMSWRKMDPNGKFAEVVGDATIIWPFVQYVALQQACGFYAKAA